MDYTSSISAHDCISQIQFKFKSEISIISTIKTNDTSNTIHTIFNLTFKQEKGAYSFNMHNYLHAILRKSVWAEK